MHSKGCEAEYVCTPAPIHNPDGTESLWCYTRPTELYGELRDRLGHFPLDRFWGPRAGIESSRWIVDSAVMAAERWRPEFWHLYLPHLDYAAQRHGPDSEEAAAAVVELDEQIGRLAEGMSAVHGDALVWLVAGEYAITAVDSVVYPNRVLREAGLLEVEKRGASPAAKCGSPAADHELIDFARSRAFAMADHQAAHVFVADGDASLAEKVAELFRDRPGIDEVLVGGDRARYGLDHPRSGEVILVARPDAWMAYYWWLDDALAPPFARTVDIHRKPGYDPVELFFDPATKSIPLDAERIGGSHGAPVRDASQRTVVLASEPLKFDPMRPADTPLSDTDVFSIVLRHFGVNAE
jgi:predicted AlkP superfamily pyrophosphatase or phosphodiesterase